MVGAVGGKGRRRSEGKMENVDGAVKQTLRLLSDKVIVAFPLMPRRRLAGSFRIVRIVNTGAEEFAKRVRPGLAEDLHAERALPILKLNCVFAVLNYCTTLIATGPPRP